MSIPRDHHLVPAFYLGQWCTATPKLIEYSRKHNKLIVKSVGPNATGFAFDLYAFPELPPEQAQFIEQKFFDYADRKATEAFRLLLASHTGKWDPELRNAWSRFLIALHLRHPHVVPELRAAAQAIWTGTGTSAQKGYEAIRSPHHPATFDEYIEATDPLIPVRARLNLIVKAFDNNIVREHINNMHWSVLDLSASSRALLTSDRAVSLYLLKSAKGSVTLPLSPTKLFIAVNERTVFDDLRRMKQRQVVGGVNTHTVARAREFVWADTRSQEAYIAKHMSTKLDPTPLLPNAGRLAQ
jgi:hypothetical protein